MKIGYITKQNPLDRKAYSGTHFSMYQSLQNHFEEVTALGPIDLPFKIIPKIKGRLLRVISRKIYKYQYDIALAKKSSKLIDYKISMQNPDVLFASLMSPEVAHLKSNKPLFITTDATFPLLNEVYNSHSNLHQKSIKEALYLEEKAFKKAKKLILPLKWLADSAIHHYGISSKKIEVVPYGSNLDQKVLSDDLESIIDHRMQSSSIKLLFVGVRWEEKGGPFLVEIFKALKMLGVNVELTIVGIEPEIDGEVEGIKIMGFLDKEIKSDMEILEKLYKESSFFVMPTKAECVGMSFIEAASFGLPAIGSTIGGVPEAVIDGETGFIFKNQSPKEVASWIKQAWQTKEYYQSLSKKAYTKYSKEMNWENWGKRVREVINVSVS